MGSGRRTRLFQKEEFPEEDPHTQCDRRIGEIEDRPDAKIQKIDDRAKPDPVCPIAEGTPQNQADTGVGEETGGVGAEAEDGQDPDAQSDQGKEEGPRIMKEAEGDPRVLDQGQMEQAREDRQAFARHKEGHRNVFGELIEDQNDPRQGKKNSSAQARRLFFSSSAWHLMQNLA